MHTLAALEAGLVATTGTRRIFVTGGETAYALCGAFRMVNLEFCAELASELGISRGRTDRGILHFAIKPGGIGTTETWVCARNGLRAWHSPCLVVSGGADWGLAP